MTLTDTRPKLLSLMRDNARAGASCQVNTKELTWGDTAVDKKEVGRYDLVLGADICYDPSGVPHLLRLITDLRAPVTIIIGPSTRPSLGALAEALAAVEGVSVEERHLSLVSSNADEATDSTADLPATVHRMLIVRQSAPPAA